MPIARETLDAQVSGVNLVLGSFADQLGDEPVLLVFLRFFGCIFCRETVADLRALAEEQPGFPKVLFVSEAAKIEIQAFLRRYWPTAATISDPQAHFYDAFGVGKSFVKAFSPSAFASVGRPRAKGHSRGPADGNIFRMPGVFLVQGEEILWSHDFRHAGERPDFEHLPLPNPAAAG